MPPFAKSPAELETFYQEAMADFPQVALRKTFGCLCAYVNGHMANGLFTDFMFLRLSPQDEAEFLELPGSSRFSPMRPNHPMKGYVIIPESVRADQTRLNSWIVRSIEHAGGLPPKIKKQKTFLRPLARDKDCGEKVEILTG